MSDPSLILDRRATLDAESKCGFHALLIGVSDYAHLSTPGEPPKGPGLAALQKLDFPARSAVRLANKLIAMDAERRLWRPLKTLRLLIAPSPAELAADPALAAAGGAPATRDSISAALWAWRDDVAKGEDEVSFFYFGGHGIRRSMEESILLASDFLRPHEPQLNRAFRLMNIFSGMAPSDERPKIGRYQFYFVDACREKPEGLDQLDDTQTPKIFDVGLNSFDNRKAPILFATPPGGLAAGVSGEGTFFEAALQWALDNGAFREEIVPGRAKPLWPMTAASLLTGIAFKNPQLQVQLAGLVSVPSPILCFREDPPSFECQFRIAPEPLRPSIGRAQLWRPGRQPRIDIPGHDTDDPCKVTIQAGIYNIQVTPKQREFKRYIGRNIALDIDRRMPVPIQIGA